MDERKELFSVDECAAIRSRSDGYKDGTDEQFHYMNGYRRACSNDPRAASAEPVAWAITVPNIPKPVAWCPSESYAKSILHEHPGGQIRRLYLDAPAAAPFTQPAASEEPSQEHYKPPFDNCSFNLCDLPGQCRGEGKCHHPATAAAGAEPSNAVHVAPVAA